MPDLPPAAGDDRSPNDDVGFAESDDAGSGGDQTAADRDQAASDTDQAASDEDQAASDRDFGGGGSRSVSSASTEARAQGTMQRLNSTRQRTVGSAVRDSVAAARDRAAEARDRAAAERDLKEDGPEGRVHRGRGGVAAERERAEQARKRAAADREQAAQDRAHAADYRIEAREERAALLRQVAVSETDELTGARARAPGLRDLQVEIARATRTTDGLAVAYVDVVGLKAVNDTLGHSAGDALLQRAVALIRTHLRSYDMIIRIGGDEFVAVMAGATVEDSSQRFEGILADAAGSGIGIRFGIARLEPGDSPSDLIERADASLLSSQPPPAAANGPAGPLLSAPEAGRPRILVTDNRPEVVALADHALAERYDCDFASTLEDAEEMLAGSAFDLVICDLRSGGDTAMSFVRRTIEGDLDTAVVLLANEDDPEVAETVFEFGAFGYVVRPLPGQLLITTMNALRRRALEISHRKLSEDREDRRQAIINMVPIGIYAKDAAGRYVLANARAEEMARVGRGKLVGMTDHAFLSAPQAASYVASDEQILRGAAVIEREDTIEFDGQAATFKTIRFPLFDEEGTIVAIGGVAADVTLEREALRLRDDLIEELELSRQETVERLTRAIDRHDASTGQHVNRLAALTGFLATKLCLDPSRVDLLRHAAPMHDVGKIGIPDEILLKPGSLSAAERLEMEGHTQIGYEILADSESELLRLAASIALTHHERYDGSGYPNHLAGEQIPIEGRITAVADVFDALLSDRIYRPALSVYETVALLHEGRGTQFDPQVLDLLLDHLDEALSVREGNP